MIICSKCNTPKDENDFYDRGDGSGKKKSRCKICDNATKHLYYEKHQEKIRKKTRKWYKSNKQKQKAIQKQYLNTPKGRLVKLMRSAKTRAKQYQHTFNLDSSFLVELWNQQGAKCALTGFKFEFENKTQHGTNPFAPSIDRINSSKGYEKDNVRLVCVAVNYALNEFGEDVFRQICRAYLNSINQNISAGNIL